jgi:hypothetical protein
MDGAPACPPPPPGYVQPTQEQLLERSLQRVDDIVYGVVTEGGAPGKPSVFKIIHVYRGNLRIGDKVETTPGWGHPEPFCVGMMSPAHPKPVGTYGVVAFANGQRTLNFIAPENVRTMIEKGWIKSAQAR